MSTFYLDVDSATHQSNFNTNVALGLRLVALTMRDTGSTTLYSAAWIPNDGRAWEACHGFSHDQLISWYTTWQAAGYEMKVITSSETLFGAVMEATSTGTQFVYDLSDSTLATQLNNNQKSGSNLVPRTFAIYGALGPTRLYAAVFEPCKENWAYRLWDPDTVATEAISAYFNDLRYRPTLLAYAPEGLLFSVFRDDSIGTDNWTVANALSPAAVTATYNSFSDRGLWPLSLSVDPTNDTFACVMVTTETPLSRQFTVSGSDIANLSPVIDPLIQNLMQSPWSSVGQPRAISVAIAYQQRLMFAKAYTWADSDYPVTDPISQFRMASCSKPITSIAIGKLLEEGVITDATTVAIIGLTPAPGGAFPPLFNSINVEELRSHRSGLQPQGGSDATIAAAYGHPTPISIYEWVAYGLTNATISPGYPSITNLGVEYQNYNFALLGLIVRAATRGLYTSYVQTNVFTPLGLTRPCIGASLHSHRPTLEVQHHSSYPSSVSQNAVTPDPPYVGGGYGGGDSENFEGFEDWSISAVDYAALLSAVGVANPGNYPVLNSTSIAAMFTKIDPSYVPGDNPANSDNFTFGGLFWETSNAGVAVYAHNGGWSTGGLDIATWVISRSDGVTATIFMNMDDAGGSFGNFAWGLQSNQLQGIFDAITAWPATGDLFPSFGVPAIVPLQLATTALPPGPVEGSYSAAVVASGGNPPYSFSVTSGSLPAGLTLNPATGIISGILTGPAGTESFTIQVADSSSPAQTASAALSIAVTADLTITTTTLPPATKGKAYNATIAATGGTPPDNFLVTSGLLPNGLTLNQTTGVISGMPTGNNGLTNFTVLATDSSNPMQTATVSLSIRVQEKKAA
jgi:CubicO group peptidase (beta-lactamase class C family)